MIRLALLALLSFAPGTWSWDPSPTATGYAFCWSWDPTYWTLAQCADTGPDTFYLPNQEMNKLWGFETPVLDRAARVLYFQIVAYNAAGYSDTTVLLGSPPDPSPFNPPPVLP